MDTYGHKTGNVNHVIDGLTLRTESDRPLVLDLSLASHLGFQRPRKIRDLIKRWESELGKVCSTVGQTSEKGGRPATEFWLTEEQALFIVAKSDTERSVEMLRFIIDVFVKVRRGETVPAVYCSASVIPRRSELHEFTCDDPISERAATFELVGQNFDPRVLRAVRAIKIDPSVPWTMPEWHRVLKNNQKFLQESAQ